MNSKMLANRSFAITALLTLLLCCAPLTVVVTAAVNSSITASSDTAPWHLSDVLVQVNVVDPDFAGDGEDQDEVPVTIKIRDETAATVGAPIYASFEEVGDSGTFIAFIRRLGSTKTAAAEPTPWTPTYITMPVAVDEDYTVSIEYLDASGPGTIKTEIEVVNVDAVLSSDRSEYPPDGVLYLRVVDQDLNDDPTDVDDPGAVSLDIEVSHGDGTTDSGTTSIAYVFEETDVNSKRFELDVDLDDLIADAGIVAPADNDIIEITFVDPVTLTEDDEDSIVIEAVEEGGVLDVPLTFTYSGELTVNVEDFDQNKDSRETDDTGTDAAGVLDQVVYLRVIDGSVVMDEEDMDLEEDGENTNIFTNDIDVTWSYDWTAAAGMYSDDGIVQIRPGQDLRISYRDPSAGGGVTSERTIEVDSVEPTITSDKESYGVGSDVELTLDNPDANDDSDTRESIRLWEGGNAYVEDGDTLADIPFRSGLITIGELSISVNGRDAIAQGDWSLVFRETEDDSGEFTLTANLDLDDVHNADDEPLEDGDDMEISWIHLIDPDEPEATVEFAIEVVAAELTLDRDNYPATRDTVVVHLTVDDSDANLDDELEDTITIGDDPDEELEVRDVADDLLLDRSPWTLTETESDSGIFEADISVDQTLTDSPRWINAKLSIVYYDPSVDDTADVTARFRIYDASLSVNATKVKYGDAMNITVTDKDENLDTDDEDSLMIWVRDEDDDVIDTFELDETGDNTGVFSDTLVVGDDFEVELDETFNVYYEDDTPVTTTSAATVWPDAKEFEWTLDTITHTGVLTVIPTPEIGPGAEITITLEDWDLNADLEEEDEVVVEVSSSTDRAGIDVTLVETDISTGIFEEDEVKTVLELTGGDNEIEVTVGDLVQIVYKDDQDAAGNDKSLVARITVVSRDPEMSLDQSLYMPGEVATLTIEDVDANSDPDLIDTVEITVESNSDPIGLTLAATETDENTAVFEVSFLIKDEIEKDTLFVAIGDTITATYTDEFPSDWPDEEEEEDFTATAVVGVVVEYPVPASEPYLVDVTGASVDTPTAGRIVLIQADISNADIMAHDFVFLAQVKDAAGAVTHIGGSGGAIEAGATMTPFISWVPQEAGTYSLEVYVWESLSEPEPLAIMQSITVTVT